MFQSITSAFIHFVGSALFLLGLPSTGLAQIGCGPLLPPSGTNIDVTAEQAGVLSDIVLSAQPGDTIRLEDGMYPLGRTLVFPTPRVTLRSRSGSRDGVILDGQYAVGELLLIQESDVTIADLTVTHAYDHPLHVAPGHSQD